MQNIRLAVGMVILCAIVGVVASLGLPVPKGNSWLAFHAYLGLTIAIAVLYLGGSVIFVKGFGGFTPRLKRAYGVLCIGFSLLGLAFVQLPLAIYGGALESVFRGAQLTALAFLAALIAIYIGTRSFAKLFNITNLSTAWWFLVVPPLILAVAYAVLPHAPTASPEVEFDAGTGFNMFNMWVALLALWHTLQVKRIAGVQYTNALAWLVVTFSIMLGSVVLWLLLILPLSDKQWLIAGTAPLVPLLFASICFVRVAYAFNRITLAQPAEELAGAGEKSFFGTAVRPKAEATVSSVDIVTFAANLASDPRSIDPLLDRLRYITSQAGRQSGGAENPATQEELQRIYLAIEQHLLEKEKVRSFTKETLRRTITGGLHLTTVRGTFWDTLPH
jgi:hypothetical protein